MSEKIIFVLTVIGGLIVIINFLLQVLNYIKDISQNEILLKTNIHNALIDIAQISQDFAVAVKQIDQRLDKIERDIAVIQNNCRKG